MVVPKGTPNEEAAMRFIAYAVCAENNAKPSEFIPYGPINKNSKPAEANKADLSVSNADENSAYFDDEYLIEHFDEIDAAYQEWKTR
jgi:putative spermidine/putrescine transport system substrate-binding protein